MKRKNKKALMKLARRAGLVPSGKDECGSVGKGGPIVIVHVHLRDEVGKAVRLAVVERVKRLLPNSNVQVFEESSLANSAPLHVMKTDNVTGFDYAGSLVLINAVAPVVANA